MIAGVLAVTQTEHPSNTSLSVTVKLTFSRNRTFICASNKVTKNK